MALNLDKIRAQRDKAAEEMARRNAKYYEWKTGRNTLRFLPPWEGGDDFTRIMGKHWNLGPEGKTMVFCPKICFDTPCPICDNIDKMWKSKPDDGTKEWLKSVSAAPRFLANVVDMSDIDSGIQIAELPKTVLLEIWNIMIDKEVGVGDITDLKAGRDIIIDKTGKGLSTRYTVRAKLTEAPVPIPIELADIPNLDNMVRNESYENLKLVWEGKEPTEAPALPPPGVTVAALPPSSSSTSPAPGMTTIDTVKVGDIHVAPTPPPPITPTPEMEAAAAAAADAETVATSIPSCFGTFNEDNPSCLDCSEQDDCENKMIEIKRAARKATAAPAAAATTPAAADVPGISAEDLMAEMEAAINR